MSTRRAPVDFGAPIVAGRMLVRLAVPRELPEVLSLRARAFRQTESAEADRDDFDSTALHMWVGSADGTGRLRATARLLFHSTGAELLAGYCARAYDLQAMAAAGGPVLELGRLCTDPDAETDAALFRLVWAGVARLVLNTAARRLIGCTSFPTVNPEPLKPALVLLRQRHQDATGLSPGRKSPEFLAFDTLIETPGPGAPTLLPPLLRAYLSMGGWVSDHLVIDRDLGTSHVFTCLDLASLPAQRRRTLSRLAAG